MLFINTSARAAKKPEKPKYYHLNRLVTELGGATSGNGGGVPTTCGPAVKLTEEQITAIFDYYNPEDTYRPDENQPKDDPDTQQ